MNERVAIVTGYNARYRAIANITVPRMREYALRNGYELREFALDKDDREAYWIKIDSIRTVLSENYDIVFWIDVDGLVLRLDADIRAALPKDKQLGLVWHGGEPPDGMLGGERAHYNAGIIVARSGDWSRDFFRRVRESTIRHYWYDQAVILHLLGFDAAAGLGPDRPDAPDRAHVARLDAAWNAIPGVAGARDPIIHHWAGVFDEARLRVIAADAALLPQRDQQGEVVRVALAQAMSALANEARAVNRFERQLRSPRMVLAALPGALGGRLRQALIPRRWR